MKLNRISSVKVSKLGQGPIRQAVLPEGFIARVIAYKEILREVETISLEETVSNFQRDLFPERELEIWERIAHLYVVETAEGQRLTPEERQKIFGDILSGTLK